MGRALVFSGGSQVKIALWALTSIRVNMRGGDGKEAINKYIGTQYIKFHLTKFIFFPHVILIYYKILCHSK